jgi:hypothetical protein
VLPYDCIMGFPVVVDKPVMPDALWRIRVEQPRRQDARCREKPPAGRLSTPTCEAESQAAHRGIGPKHLNLYTVLLSLSNVLTEAWLGCAPLGLMPWLAELIEDLHEGDISGAGDVTVAKLYRDAGARVCQGSC